MKKSQHQIRYDGELREVEAAEFAVFGYGIFIVHKDATYPTLWTVSEPRTGLYITSKHPTRKAALQKAIAAVCAITPETLEHLTQSQIRQYESAKTRYQEAYEKELCSEC